MARATERGGPKAGWILTGLLGLLICAAPALLWGQALRSYFLHLDDFVYFSGSRTWQSLLANLLQPHNAHVVPLFRIETFLLAKWAGGLRHLPEVLGLACYLTLLSAMIASGCLVACETGRPALGLAAMAAVGVSTVLGPSVLWYAAGQALMSGTCILTMLIALQSWRRWGSWPLLTLAFLAGIAAPLVWSGGYAAGPTALAYLWHVQRNSARLVGLGLVAVTILIGLGAWRIVQPEKDREAAVSEGPGRLAMRIPAGLSHMAQAIPEVLIFNNLGLDARTAEYQGWALCLMTLTGWYYTRRWPGEPPASRVIEDAGRAGGIHRRIDPLEAAGVMLIVIAFSMVYTARGGYTFENLRALGWYHAIPQLGAVLVAAGWWSGWSVSLSPARVEAASLWESGWVLALVVVLLLLQGPRANRVMFDYDGAAAPLAGGESEAGRSTGPASHADLKARAANQRRVLERLDRLEEIARSRGIGRAALRRVLGKVTVPGMPDTVVDLDGLALLRIPEEGILADPRSIQDAVAGAMEDDQP